MNDIMKRLEQLNTLIELSALVNSTLDTGEIRKRAIEAAMKLLEAEAGSLILVDQDTGDLFFEVALGNKGEHLKEVRLKKGEGIAGWVAEKGEALIVHDVQSDQRFFKAADKHSAFETKNILCVPVRSKDKILGVLEALNKRHGVFDEGDKQALMALANQVAIAIENANLYQELMDTFYATAEALAETIEKRDPYTGGHTKRVLRYSYRIGQTLGLSKKELEDLKLAAILHDVGKIGVSDNILLKKGKLSPEEAEQMHLHPRYGAEILSHVKQLKGVIPSVRSHHERIDGSGYPDKLKGEDIPGMAKIIAVADAFDAMTTDRPYRKAMSNEEAFEELRRHAGVQFDRDIVHVFIALIGEKEGSE
jgi:HD-GYP domain-containing protein (c-di-GMP phosphodiesterase class II)